MTYETKDSGQRQEYASGMRRDTQEGKPDLIQWMPMSIPYKETLWYRMGLAAERGAVKYGRRNWELAGEHLESAEEELERFRSSAYRHLTQWLHGEEDEDHASAVVFNLVCAEMVKTKINRSTTKLDIINAALERASQLSEEALESNFWDSHEEHTGDMLELYRQTPLSLRKLIAPDSVYPDFGGYGDIEAFIVEYHPDYAWIWEEE